MARRAVTEIESAQLERLAPLVELTSTTRATAAQAGLAHRAFISGLVHASASHLELSVLNDVTSMVGVHIETCTAIVGSHPPEYPLQAEVHQALFEAFREGDPAAVERAMHDLNSAGENAALLLLGQVDLPEPVVDNTLENVIHRPGYFRSAPRNGER